MRLLLRSADDHQGQVLTWRGPKGGRPALALTLVMDYDAGLAGLPMLTRLVVKIAPCLERTFALLSVEPLAEAAEQGQYVSFLEEAPTGPLATESDRLGWAFGFRAEAGTQLARDIEQLLDLMGLRDNVSQMAVNSAGRLGKN